MEFRETFRPIELEKEDPNDINESSEKKIRNIRRLTRKNYYAEEKI